jgi:N-hydroxyarylamine O-acetyltransferase
MNLDAYFERIGYAGPTAPTLSVLVALHRAHLLAVPFENLDIHRGRRITLDEAALFDKLVTRRRGGFCYEQNALFAAVLRTMGYDVSLLEARVRRPDGGFGIPFDHMTLLVRLEVRWLVDVGFGDSFVEPLRLDYVGAQVQPAGVFRVELDGTTGRYSRQQPETGWRAEYEFYLTPRCLSDFADGCHYHQTAPETSFTQRRVCSLALPGGRVTLTAPPPGAAGPRRLIVTRDGIREERDLEDEAAFVAALRVYCGITLNS